MPCARHLCLKGSPAVQRPRTTTLSANPPVEAAKPLAPSWQETAATVGGALIYLVAAIESQPSAGPAVKAFRTAIRPKGEEAAAAGGREVMEAVPKIVRDAAPDRAERREALIDAAWSGLPEWRS